jgi:AcrR family transcriptional regulator
MPGRERKPADASATAPGHGDGSEADIDVRIRRTRSRLQNAVLQLAGDKPVEEISVADLVRTARINRTTFYKHAENPEDVLARALYSDLDRRRAQWLAETAAPQLPTRESWRRAAQGMLGHLERHDAVYTRGLTGRRPSGVLQQLLAEHFAATLRTLIDRDPRPLPEQAGPGAWRAEVHSRFIAYGEVGVVAAWLALPAPRDPRLFVSATTAVLPDWLTPANQPG